MMIDFYTAARGRRRRAGRHTHTTACVCAAAGGARGARRGTGAPRAPKNRILSYILSRGARLLYYPLAKGTSGERLSVCVCLCAFFSLSLSLTLA